SRIKVLGMKFSLEPSPAFLARPAKAKFAPLFRILAVGALAISLHAGEWQLGFVKDAVGGRFSSLRLDKLGNAHICSSSPAYNTLAYSFWDHVTNRWFTSVIDASSGFCSLALDSQQHPHISYIGYGTGKLKYAYWTGNSWIKQDIEIK